MRTTSSRQRRSLAALMAMSLTFAACGDDDDSAEVAESPSADTAESDDGADSTGCRR
jgi:hypothetical protein